MAGPFDLTGQDIENTYQRVLQTDGTLIYDGTGSLFTISGSGGTINTGSFVTTSSFNAYTGSNTSQFAGTASYALTASYVQNAQTASFVVSASYAQTASFVQNAQTASYVQNAQTASFVQNAQTASYVQNAVSSSFASTASFVRTAQTASYVLNAVSSSFASTASYAANGGVTKIIAGGGITISPSLGLGDVTINSTAATFNTATGSYGSFFDTGSVFATSATAVYSMSLNTTDISNGVFISASNGDNTRVKFTNAGTYNLQFSSQFSNTDNSTQDIIIWVRKNGVDIPDSSGVAGVPPFKAGSNGQVIASWNYYLSLSAGDFIQMCWHVEQANVITLETIPAGVGPTHPRTPSTILTANRVDTFLSNTGSFSGSFTGNFTGSLLGTATTASYVLNAVSSSFASTASFVRTAQTASYVLNAVSSSFASTASYVQNAQTASYVLNAVSSSFASTASYVLNAVSSSFASTASFVNPLTQTVTINGKLIQTGSHIQGSSTNTANGAYSHAEGSSNNATGDYSHVEGITNNANGQYSHAEGQGTTSTGNGSHAEGANTTATGTFSHAEGEGSTSTGNYSHAEGSHGTVAQGIASHAEGWGAIATGAASHAEGVETIAIGDYSHAEGATTTAGYMGYYSGTTGVTAGVFSLESTYGDLTSIFTAASFALFEDPAGLITGTANVIKSEVLSSTFILNPFTGDYTEVTLVDTTIGTGGNPLVVGISGTSQPAGANYPIGNYSHAAGETTSTIGQSSHAEGVNTNAVGYYSHAEGIDTIAIGVASHAEGNNTLAQGYASHAEGNKAFAIGDYSHAEGLWTVASGSYQHAQGQYNIASSAQSAFIVGNGTADASRSNLIFASGSQVQITGSLIVSGSGTFINIGPAIFSGSVTSTSGFTGSLQGTATTASYFSGTVVSASYAQTASFVQTAQTASFVQTAQTASFVTGSIFTNGNRALSASYAITASFVPGTIGGSGTAGSIAKFSGTATIGNATADTDYLINSVSTIAYTAMGSTIKGNGVAVDKPHNMTSNGSLTAGTVFFIAYYLPKAETITGVKWFQGTVAAGSSGSFGLYSVSGGTITRQASSSFDSTVFSTSQNTFKSKAFTSTYAAPAGLYYIGVISGGATGIIGNISAFNSAIYGADFTNTNRVVASVVSASLPTTQALSGTSAAQSAFGLFLY